MLYLGITKNSSNTKKNKVFSILRYLSYSFFFLVILPFIIWTLFYFKVFTSKPVFSADIQQPVAKVIGKKNVGTAFLVSPTKLLTARHVVNDLKIGETVNIVFEKTAEKQTFAAKIIFYLPDSMQPDSNGFVDMNYFLTDIAVLEIPEVKNITPLAVGQSDGVSELEEVVLMGYPNGDYSISKGNINSLRFQDFDLFKLDAVSNPGNSGGPVLLAIDNSVIGILVGGSGPGYQGENIALKISTVIKILKENGINIE